MKAYRVTKCDPQRRDAVGAYPDDEWTCPSQIGQRFGGREFTLDDYLAAETSYVTMALAFWEAAGRPALAVRGLEDKATGRADLRAELRALIYSVPIRNDMEVSDATTLGSLIRLNLRTLAWCRLEAVSGFYIHFGWDYYLFVGGVTADAELRALARATGMFIEASASPVEPTPPETTAGAPGMPAADQAKPRRQSERGKRHPIMRQVRGYAMVGMQAEWEPDQPFLLLRLTYRHPASRHVRRFELRIPVDQVPGLDAAFPVLMRTLTFLDHTQEQWEGREIEIRFRGNYPWPIYADSVRELPPT